MNDVDGIFPGCPKPQVFRLLKGSMFLRPLAVFIQQETVTQICEIHRLNFHTFRPAQG